MKCYFLLLLFLASVACRTNKVNFDWSHFKDVVPLGEGSFGSVYKATSLSTGRHYAIKEQTPTTQNNYDLAKQEIALLKEITEHKLQYVTPLHWYDIKTNNHIYMGFDVYSGDLKKYMEKTHSIFRKAESDMIAFRLLVGLHELRKRNIANLDIKPENILVNNRNRPYIADFGLAQTIGEGKTKYGSRGTPLYKAPEMLLHNEYTIRADVWSMGLVLYELFTGKRAIYASTLVELTQKVKHFSLKCDEDWPYYPDYPSIDYKTIICDHMLQFYTHRASISGIYSNYLLPWANSHGGKLPQFRSYLKRRRNPELEQKELLKILKEQDEKAEKTTKEYGFSEIPTDPLHKPICKKKNEEGELVDC